MGDLNGRYLPCGGYQEVVVDLITNFSWEIEEGRWHWREWCCLLEEKEVRNTDGEGTGR